MVTKESETSTLGILHELIKLNPNDISNTIIILIFYLLTFPNSSNQIYYF